MKYHFIGIGGIGMSGLAEYLAEKGHTVTGSDTTATVITERLEKTGIKVYYGHSESNLPEDTDIVVYTSAVKDRNPELQKAKELNIEFIKRAEMLGRIVNDKYLIAVSGTHGKTTTTAMIAKVLIEDGLDPTVFVGGSVDFLEGGASRTGKGKIAVVEADEYDRSFLTLRPDIIVITNLEKDHSDIYKNIEELKMTFKEFINLRKESSRIIAFGDDDNVRSILAEMNPDEVIYYGLENANQYRATEISEENYSTEYYQFTRNKTVGKVELSVKGKHNILNSLAAALATGFCGVTMQSFKKSIKKFKGVKRRLELVYKNGLEVYDDYAHHPTEVKASFDAVKNTTQGRIITVFQPHLYSRTAELFREFAESLKDNDIVLLLDIYPAREEKIEGISSELIFNEFKKISKNEIIYVHNPEILNSQLYAVSLTGDTIIFQGAGNVTEYCKSFVNYLKEKRG